FNTTGTVTQSEALTAANLRLLGVGGAYTLTNAGNDVTVIAADTGSIDLNNGGNAITVDTVGGTAGITTTGVTKIVNAGLITLEEAISGDNTGGTAIELSGTGFVNNAGA